MQSITASNKTLIAAAALALVVVGLAAALLMAGGGGGEGVLEIGMSVSLTGKYKPLCEQGLAGAYAAALWINDNGGVKAGDKVFRVEIKYYDDKSSADEAVRRVEYMIRQEGIQILLAPCGPDLVEEAARVADDNGALMLVYGDAPDAVFEQGYRMVVQAGMHTIDYFRSTLEMAKYIDRGASRVAIIYLDNPFAENAARGARKAAAELGFEVVFYESYSSDLSDLEPLLLRLQATDPHIIIGGGLVEDGIVLARTLAEFGIEARLISLLVAPALPEFGERLGRLAEGIAYPTPWELASTPYETPEGFQFYGPTREEFYQYFNRAVEELGLDLMEPSYHAALAAKAVLTLAKAVEESGSTSPEDLREALSQIKLLAFSGVFQIDPETGAHLGGEMLVAQWIGRRRVLVWPPGQAFASPLYPHPGWPG